MDKNVVETVAKIKDACISGNIKYLETVDFSIIGFAVLRELFFDVIYNYKFAQYIYKINPDVFWSVYDEKLGKYKHLRNVDELFTTSNTRKDQLFVMEVRNLNPNINITKHKLYWRCFDGHFDILQWWYDNVPFVHDHEYLINAFSGACNGNWLNIVEWIFNLGIIEDYNDIDEKLIPMCLDIEVFDFLYANIPIMDTIIHKNKYLNEVRDPILIARLISLGCTFDNYDEFNELDEKIRQALIPVLDLEGLEFYLKETQCAILI
jgi:hypothetical protein